MSDERQVCVVTGGSRGIGAATAVLLAERGWDVAVSYRARSDAADEVVGRCRAHGQQALAVQCDVDEEADVVRLFETARDQLGQVTGVVNNAGVVPVRGDVEAITADGVAALLRTNVVGAFVVAREAVRHMSTAHGGRGGSVVNVSSRSATSGAPHEYVQYAASKAALDALTTGLSREVTEQGIRVNGVRPALIDTEIHAPGRLAELIETIPMGRIGTAHEVATAIVWLLSDEASFVTGTFIDITGGR